MRTRFGSNGHSWWLMVKNRNPPHSVLLSWILKLSILLHSMTMYLRIMLQKNRRGVRINLHQPRVIWPLQFHPVWANAGTFCTSSISWFVSHSTCLSDPSQTAFSAILILCNPFLFQIVALRNFCTPYTDHHRELSIRQRHSGHPSKCIQGSFPMRSHRTCRMRNRSAWLR